MYVVCVVSSSSPLPSPTPPPTPPPSLLSLADLPVTVMEYSGPLDSLSSQDVDQKLLNSRLEECSVCVDTSVMRVLETVRSTSKTRCQRDLGEYMYLSLWENVYVNIHLI